MLCAGPTIFDAAVDLASRRNWSVLDATRELIRRGRRGEFEVALSRGSTSAAGCRALHTAKSIVTGGGNGEVVIGSDGFLFLRKEFTYVQSQGVLRSGTPAAGTIIPSMLKFHDDLRRRGIQLIVLPVPAKLSIYPENARISHGRAAPPVNVDRAALFERLSSANVEVVDLLLPMWEARS